METNVATSRDHEKPAANHGDTPDRTAEHLAESKAYSRQKLYCHLADLVLDIVLLAVLVTFAWPLDRWLTSLPALEIASFRLAAFVAVAAVVQYVVSFPLSLYAGFTLEHKYALSRQTFPRWLRRDLGKNSLMFAFGLLMVEGLFWLIWLAGPYWWLAAAAASFVVSVVLGQLVPVLILPLFYKIERLNDEGLAERFRRLAEGTSLAIEGVYRMKLSAETVKANAMLAGLGRTRRVILGDTLLDGFTPEEIEVVLAHEIGHHVFHHIPKLIAIGLVMSVAGFFACDRVLVWWLGGDSFAYEQVPVYALPMLMLVVTVFSVVTGPLSNALSRQFERQCDRYALRRTGLREAYVSAFTRLGRLNKADPDPHPLEKILFHDHPPIAERLALAHDSSDQRPV